MSPDRRNEGIEILLIEAITARQKEFGAAASSGLKRGKESTEDKREDKREYKRLGISEEWKHV